MVQGLLLPKDILGVEFEWERETSGHVVDQLLRYLPCGWVGGLVGGGMGE